MFDCVVHPPIKCNNSGKLLNNKTMRPDHGLLQELFESRNPQRMIMSWVRTKKERDDRLKTPAKGVILRIASRNNSPQVARWKLHCNSSIHQTSPISHQTFFIFTSKDGLSCTACTLQWYWSSGNSCVYDGDYFDYYRGIGAVKIGEMFGERGAWILLDVGVWLESFTNSGRSRGEKHEEHWKQGNWEN